MTIIKVVKDDKTYDINFTLQDANGNAINLTNATMQLKVQASNSTELKFAGTMNTVSAASGTCKYTVAQGNFNQSGNFNAEIEVSYTGTGEIITFPDILFKVKDDLPKT